MSKEIYISSTPHETRLAIVENDELAEIYYERENEYTLAGSIYNGRVTRVLPGMQSSFVEIGLERDAFLYITDFMEEAGDSADFETTHGGSGEARAPRSDRQSSDRQSSDRQSSDRQASDRNGRNDRSDRGERPAPVVLEGNLEASSERAPEGRSDRDPNSRGDRNGRGRNRRGRGERNGRPDRAPAAETSEAPSIFEAPLPVPSAIVSEAGELGEGAPGADGSRRWRGRRGRRRGRSGTGQPGDANLEVATPTSTGENEFSDYSVEVGSPRNRKCFAHLLRRLAQSKTHMAAKTNPPALLHPGKARDAATEALATIEMIEEAVVAATIAAIEMTVPSVRTAHYAASPLRQIFTAWRLIRLKEKRAKLPPSRLFSRVNPSRSIVAAPKQKPARPQRQPRTCRQTSSWPSPQT